MKREYQCRVKIDKYFDAVFETDDFADENGEITDWDLFEATVFGEFLEQQMFSDNEIEIETWIGAEVAE